MVAPWWSAAHRYVETQPLSNQDVNALYSLLDAQTKGDIRLPAQPFTELYRRAHTRYPQRPDLVTLYANALLNVSGDVALGGQMLQRATVLAPKDGQIWANLIDYQLATGQLVQAAAGLERLAELNRGGRYDTQWQALQQKYQALSPARSAAGGRP
jgi:predicted Zn-dependent protease